MFKTSAKLNMNEEMSGKAKKGKGLFAQEEPTLQNALEDIDSLINLWKDLKPEGQTKLKLIIDHKISLLQSSKPPLFLDWGDKSKYPLLENLHKLGKKLTAIGFKDDAVDDAVIEELDVMISKLGIVTPAPTEHGDPEPVSVPEPRYSDPGRFPFTFFHWVGQGTLSAQESSKPYFLVYDSVNVNYYVVAADGYCPDYLELHYTIDVGGALQIEQVSGSPNIRLSITILNGASSVFYLRIATEEKANAFIQHLQGHTWMEKSTGSISSFEFKKGLAYAERNLSQTHANLNSKAKNFGTDEPNTQAPGSDKHFEFVVCRENGSYLNENGEFQMFYHFNSATGTYSPIYGDEDHNGSCMSISEKKYLIEAREITDVYWVTGSCTVGIEAEYCSKYFQVTMKTPKAAFEFYEHLRQSQP